MGRGAGNAQTEYLLLEMNLLEPGRYNPEAMFALVMDRFEPLRKKYGWGPNLLYYLSGTYGIHPTYVQEMLGRGRYDTLDLIGALSFLRKAGATSYSDSALQKAMQGETGGAKGSWTATGWAEGRDVLLVASGPGGVAHRDAVVRYVERNKPVVICLNVIDHMPAEHVTAYAACNPTRLLIEAEKYHSLTRPLIAPRLFAPQAVRERLSGLQLLDYGIEVRPDTFEVSTNGCVLPTSIVAGYGLAVAVAAGARRILLAGFDGYSDISDPRRQEMVKTLRCYAALQEALPLLAVTPTSYDVPKSSIYAPGL
jgi:4-hydroxy 2-oxovalerate aldolase